jgi:hypothetical protein
LAVRLLPSPTSIQRRAGGDVSKGSAADSERMLAALQDPPPVPPVPPIGRRADQSSAQGIDSRRDQEVGLETEQTRRRRSSAAGSDPLPGSEGTTGGTGKLAGEQTSAAAFSAQQMFQEKMGSGLHIEPWQQAISSYQRASGLTATNRHTTSLFV